MYDNIKAQIVEPEKVLSDSQKEQAKKLAGVFTLICNVVYLAVDLFVPFVVMLYVYNVSGGNQQFWYVALAVFAIYFIFKIRDFLRGVRH